jgi:hypothetical protein
MMQGLIYRTQPRYALGGLDVDANTGLALAFAAGAAFGAAVMFLIDPDGGRQRRALIRDQIVHAQHEFGDLAEDARGRAQDARNRAQGAAHEMRSATS